MTVDQTILVVTDVQGKLATIVHEHEQMLSNIERLIRIFQILKIPIIWSEQSPNKIGATIEPVAALLRPTLTPIAKQSFSAYAHGEFRQALDQSGRRNVIIVGIETHVCIYQTARDMHRHGYTVHVAEDAVSSRTRNNKDIAVARMRAEGMVISSAEMVITELLGGAEHPQFKEVMSNIKR